MAEHIEVVMSITGSLFILIIGFIAWQGKRQIGRIDTMETRMMKIENTINETVNSIKDNYLSRFDNIKGLINDNHIESINNQNEIKLEVSKLVSGMENQISFCKFIQEAKKETLNSLLNQAKNKE